jgi:hypothetical protein
MVMFSKNQDPLLAIGGTHNRMAAYRERDYGDVITSSLSECRIIYEPAGGIYHPPYDQDREEAENVARATTPQPQTPRDIGNRVLFLTAPDELLKPQS